MLILAFQNDSAPSDELVDACGDSPRWACEWVFDQTDNEALAGIVDWVIDRPLRIGLVVLVAWIVKRIVHHMIGKVVDRIRSDSTERQMERVRRLSPGVLAAADDAARERGKARAETVGLVLRSFSSALIWTIALFVVLSELDVNVAPLIAGAGIAGIALGFGAQSVVQDFLSGMFMLIEDHYGVGDVIDVGDATGTVERMSLRTTSIRDAQGTVWHISNGEIRRVGNFSQLWSRALIDVGVAYETDIRLAQGVIQRVGTELWEDPEWGDGVVMEPPEVLGVQNLGGDAVQIRLIVKTRPSSQWTVERELRLRIKEALDEAGIEMPFAQRTVWLRQQGDVPMPQPVDPATVRVAPIPHAHDDEAQGPDEDSGERS
ncbi:MAG: mechanosensitive ion channel family protein [Acidobacteria bacterium]|nr:mechanosensitive ion channel family protein [Acidobacteriota bacterium]